MLDNHLKLNCNGKANKQAIILGDGYRITVLTPCIIRVEINPTNQFIDEPSQIFINRNLEVPNYKTLNRKFFQIDTDLASFYFNFKKKKITCVKPKGFIKSVQCNNEGNLLGTCRTLDNCYSKRKLENGILSTNGVVVIDDSNSLLFNESGEIRPRESEEKDLYIFAHGHDYLLALSDFCALTGNIPVIPRYALGNWWSRYRAYTDTEYKEVITKFEDKKIPLSVATIDMDWHWTDADKRFGYKSKKNLNNMIFRVGWTGYSWNSELFPDYKEFLNWLKNKDLKITLNIHPADGVRWFENQYKNMCNEMGLNFEDKKDIPFDLASDKFINAYFKILHKPYEKDGVDFWWIDWQQGKNSTIKGLDPLYALNHYHYLDNAKCNDEPLILSRYAGLGSHRYPLGFSGDTFANWKVLDFIPYFTANSSNVGYTWWSHDIGGHHFGVKDDELYLRWIQFGVFNPIMRLHSSSHDLLGKEPWKCNGVVEDITTKNLKLRKQLIPYIFSMDIKSATESVPLCMPMYYLNPETEDAYKCKNEYYFGSELIVAPITHKLNKTLNMAYSKAYLPNGRWTDVFTGQIYNGGKNVKLFRDLKSIPVLAKEGAIIPLDKNDFENGVDLPTDFEILIYRGNNEFKLIEGNKNLQSTTFSIEEDKNIIFKKSKMQASINLDKERNYEFNFKDIIFNKAKVLINGKTVESNIKENKILLKGILNSDEVEIVIDNYQILKNINQKEYIINIFSKMQCKVLYKEFIYKQLSKSKDNEKYIKYAKNWVLIPKIVKEAIKEYDRI